MLMFRKVWLEIFETPVSGTEFLPGIILCRVAASIDLVVNG